MISGPNYKTSIGNSVWGIAGYYADYDGLQHVVVAAKDGNVYEAHWSQEVAPTVGSLGDLGTSLVDIAAFFTLDDNFHHAVGVTSDGTLHELYYNLGQAPTRRNLYHISSFDASKGAAGFYSPGDTLRHVVIVDAMDNPIDISWNGQQQPTGNRITIPPTDSCAALPSACIAWPHASRRTTPFVMNSTMLIIRPASKPPKMTRPRFVCAIAFLLSCHVCGSRFEMKLVAQRGSRCGWKDSAIIDLLEPVANC